MLSQAYLHPGTLFSLHLACEDVGSEKNVGMTIDAMDFDMIVWDVT